MKKKVVLGKKTVKKKSTAKKKAPAKKRKRPAKAKKPKVVAELDYSQPLSDSLHEQYCQAMLDEPNPLRAYLKVQPHVTYGSAGTMSSRLLKRVEIVGRLGFLLSESADRAIASRTELLKGYTEVFRADITDYLTCGIDGVWYVEVGKDLPNTRAIKKIKTTTRIIGEGDDVQSIQITELELKDMMVAGEKLAKLLGLLDKDTGDGDSDAERRLTDIIKKAMDKTAGLPDHIRKDLKVMKGEKSA